MYCPFLGSKVLAATQSALLASGRLALGNPASSAEADALAAEVVAV